MKYVHGINLIGAGFAGLSAALTFARRGLGVNLISLQMSERAQSVMAEGGINAALDTMGEGDTASLHFEETMRGGCDLADPNAVQGLTAHAPEIVRELLSLGVPFDKKNGTLMLRPFGGQKKRRTAYAMSSTGKVMMTALIDEVRKYEASGLVHRYPHHEAYALSLSGESVGGVFVRDLYTEESMLFMGPVLLACGGLNGLFPGLCTGSAANDASLAAALFAQGVLFGNLEMIQYHPTTVPICGKRMLISEAARGEGGRLFIKKNGQPWYFMEEERFPLQNLMPRDVVSREMARVAELPECSGSVYLDMRGLPESVWTERLADMRAEIKDYTGRDPKSEPIPVSPGIHFFMGGVLVDEMHRTSHKGLYAAGECACAYHGANRLGGNSMLAAIYGGRVAAECICKDIAEMGDADAADIEVGESAAYATAGEEAGEDAKCAVAGEGAGKDTVRNAEAEQRISSAFDLSLYEILSGALGLRRDGERLSEALSRLLDLQGEALTTSEQSRAYLAEAMLRCALARKESRGAHVRSDYPERNDAEFQKTTIAQLSGGEVRISFRELPKLRSSEEAVLADGNIRMSEHEN